MKRIGYLWILLACAGTLAAAPVIRLPLDGDRVGADKPTRQVHAEGSVPDDRIGIFAVEPLNASPSIWIQPFTPDVFGGNVSATVYLGELKVGMNQFYRIYLLGCKADHGLEAGQETTLEDIRSVCEWSNPVTVYRER